MAYCEGSESVKIDSHQHYWLYEEKYFGWLEGPYLPLRRDFLPADVQPEMESLAYGGAVAVQAREVLDENTFLLDLAARFPQVVGVVGWVDLRSEACEVQLEHFASNPKFKGVRHIAQGQPAGFFEEPSFLQGVSLLSKYKLTYDILVYENQIEEATRFAKRFPNQRFVLDHGGKPPIASGRHAGWEKDFREMAKLDNVYCKLSGLATEADLNHWNAESLERYVSVLLEAFGPNRLMIGSDWPVCLAAGDYETVVLALEQLIGKLSRYEQWLVLGGTAAKFYGLAY